MAERGGSGLHADEHAEDGMNDASRIVAVTGAASGIGRAVVRSVCRSGDVVVALDNHQVRLRQLRHELGAAIHVVAGDATTVKANAELAAAGSSLGGLDALVCCVGIFDQYQPLAQLTAQALNAAFTEIFDVNVRSTLLAVHAVQEQLLRRQGSVVLTLSGAAFYPEGGGVLYGATKWSLRGVLAHLAAELAPRVRVNAVAPGGTSGTATAGLHSLGQRPYSPDNPGRDARLLRRSPLGVVATPEDVAAAYQFLLGPGAATMTGCTLHPDGGLAAGAVRSGAAKDGPIG
jgi:NAD(P)-dependent dehydrogenase (short-subunit alcohol dehydrogenase family)